MPPVDSPSTDVGHGQSVAEPPVTGSPVAERPVAEPPMTGSPGTEPPGAARIRLVLVGLAVLCAASIVAFLTIGVDGHWDFALPRRLEQVVALTIVGVAVALSTVIFQTVTENRILTPSIMGFDALYVLLATTLVFVLGGPALATMPPLAKFAMNAGVLMLVATLLYRWVLSDEVRGLTTLVLVGVIAATLFRTVTAFMFRLISPNEFDNLMADLFASFNVVDTAALGISAVLLAVAIVAAVRAIPELDVLTLGRAQSIALGVDHRAVVTRLLVIVAALVSVSTSLVGPILFLGLLVANLAFQLTGTHRHAVTFTASALAAVVALVLGQTFLQHVLTFNGTIDSIINLVGGVYFVVLLVRQSRP